MRPSGKADGGAVPTKDLEGVSEVVDAEPAKDTFKGKDAPAASTVKGNRQKKIAVLTSGGDSAGMNAAGEHLAWEFLCCQD
jgi:hypothetical protein